MSPDELEKLLVHLSNALDVIRNTKEPLNGPEISVKSMLTVTLMEVSDELAEARMRLRAGER